ncbi:3-hydroxyacyl-ACP dehydratase FabZ family protein [Streptacidiphilus neutrinimicus]|uniref:3-hydroxyacyl-ACP dehydratase FabZ family protein n=1 Tax=Streptacidiphilus neutrinimicus TaxID=105420 RepID=UPI000693D3E8|nr:hypothetical protein [Streptacidiphilus neutrinimicus]
MPRQFAAPLDAIDIVDTAHPHEVTATKAIRADDPYLSGHYPHFTIYPGIFIIESVGQAVRAHVAEHHEASAPELAEVGSVRFTAPLVPGNTLTLKAAVTVGEVGEGLLRVKADCRREDGARCAAMTLTYRLIETEEDSRAGTA